MTYETNCISCEFTKRVEELDDVFDLQEAHRSEAGDDHALDFERLKLE